MKRAIFILSVILFWTSYANASQNGTISTYTDKNKFGLQTIEGEVITSAKYKKLIRLGSSAWIVQKGSKFGLLNNSGDYIIEPKYSSAERIIGRFVKFGRGSVYGLYDENGYVIAPEKYSSIDLLFGKMFLVGKDGKCGLIGFDGHVILEPVVDDIYMPKPNVMNISYGGKWYEIEQVGAKTLQLPDDIRKIKEDTDNFKITEIINKPIPSTGYGVVSAGDYILKVFTSISPAYESTIDELVLSHGADVASILVKSSWLAKFPFVYARNYYNTVKTPNNGPFSDIKANLKEKIKEEG